MLNELMKMLIKAYYIDKYPKITIQHLDEIRDVMNLDIKHKMDDIVVHEYIYSDILDEELEHPTSIELNNVPLFRVLRKNVRLHFVSIISNENTEDVKNYVKKVNEVKLTLKDIFTNHTDYQIYHELIKYDETYMKYSLTEIIHNIKNNLCKTDKNEKLKNYEQQIVNNLRNIKFVIIYKKDLLNYNNKIMRDIITEFVDRVL